MTKTIGETAYRAGIMRKGRCDADLLGTVEIVKARAKRMARYSLKLAGGRYHDAIALLARRCRPASAHTLARALLVGASQINTDYQAKYRRV